jgi:hypothetical protein
MNDLVLLITVLALLYGFTWHDRPAREGESEEESNRGRVRGSDA